MDASSREHDTERLAASDDEESLSSLATFSSQEEAEEDIFADYDPSILDRIEINDPDLRRVYDPLPRANEWVTFGRNVGRNTCLEWFGFCADWIDDAREEDGEYDLEAFCAGLSANRSLKFLQLEEYDLGGVGLEILHPLVVENNNLVHLGLHSCSLANRDIMMLSNAFGRRRNPLSIKSLAFAGREINDETVPGIIELCNHCPELRKLDLSYSNLGDKSCNIIASVLENPESKLKILRLNRTSIGDVGAQILGNGIAYNKRLKRLELENFNRISPRGWDTLLRVLCDTSSIEAVYKSNHVLVRMSWLSEGRGLSDEILFSLQANLEAIKTNTIRRKVIHIYMRGNFNVSPFRKMNMEALPHVLSQIGKEYRSHEAGVRRSRLSAFYHILRNVPELCNFPSFERKVRQKLELENAAVTAENKFLKGKNDELNVT